MTLGIGAFGLRLSRTTSDFYVASRTVSPRWNASAIGGEYLSAASFLGVAGLVYSLGADMLWFPVGYTVGYLVLLVLVAAPLRRSGAYTLPDFAEARLESAVVRRLCAGPGARDRLALPAAAVPGRRPGPADRHRRARLGRRPRRRRRGLANVVAGGMRSITLVQAVQYWLKLTAISVPAFLLLWLWVRAGQPRPGVPPRSRAATGRAPLSGFGGRDHPVYATYSTLLALCFGTMGLPHVLVRFYTNPDGRAARRTTVVVIGLLGAFYVFTPLYGVLGRVYLPHLPDGVRADSVVLMLPAAMSPGLLGELMSALLAGGAFAAFLSTASGLTVSVAGVIDQDLLRRRLSAITGGDAVGCKGSGSLPSSRWSCPTCWRWRPAASGSRTRWAWPSPSRPRRSARCWCWGSGGAGCPPWVPRPASWPAAPSR